jgi:hypothetical protein
MASMASITMVFSLFYTQHPRDGLVKSDGGDLSSYSVSPAVLQFHADLHPTRLSNTDASESGLQKERQCLSSSCGERSQRGFRSGCDGYREDWT